MIEMSDVHNGGPAFPASVGPDYGMTLRDYFAAKAMQALINRRTTGDETPLIAEDSYHIADAMLKERMK